MTCHRARICCLVFVGTLTPGVSLGAPVPQQPPRIVLSDDETELERALASRTPPRDLPVRVGAVSLPDDDPAMVRLLVVARIDDPRESVPLASVAYVLTQQGERRASAVRRRDLRRYDSSSLSFLDVVSVPPGTYRLTLAAMRNGRLGTGEASVVAGVQWARGVRLGDLLIGDVPGDEAMTSVMPERRVRGNRLVVTLPLGVDQVMPADIAMTLAVSKNGVGAAMLSAPLSLVPGEGRSRLAQAVADARVLPSGDYVAKVVVTASGGEVGRIVAPFTLDRTASAAGSVPDAVNLVPAFRLEDVLNASVLGPFLDDLGTREPERTRAAIAQAKAGRLVAAAQASKDANEPARSLLRGLSLLSQKQLQPASDAFRQTLRAAPEFFVGAFYIGACYAAGGKDSEAVNAWQTSLVGLEEYPIVFRLIGEALTRMGQIDRAIEALEEASAKWPEDRDLRLRLARAAFDAGRYELVTATVDAGLTRPPVDADLLRLGMQAIFERVTRTTVPEAEGNAALIRLNRYREAYVAAGGPNQSLVNEWAAAVEKKLSVGRI